jgi:hypothetical protein
MNEITNKKYVNTGSLNAEIGIKSSPLYEPSNDPVFNQTSAEKVIQGKNNTFIVLGRDRPGGMESGYGGLGHVKAGAIDIVVGRVSNIDTTTLAGPVNSNTGADAARVYLSQKADIDKYYNLVDGKTGQSEALSAVAIKADAVRIIARDSLKLVTNTDAKLSNGEDSYSGTGVQLIANNDDSDMQPIPKGENLVDALDGLIESIEQLNGLVFGFMEIQKKYNDAISEHTHYSPFYGLEDSPSPATLISGKETALQTFLKVEQGLKSHINNLKSWKTRYIYSTGTKYINSSYHFLN